MVRVRKKEGLNETVSKMVLEAPMIAKKAQPGQFVIVRAKKESERIPLTIADYDHKEGTVTIIYQIVGAGTMELDTVREGEYVQDLVGPLGKASETEGLHKVAVVGGGVGCAIAYPLAKKLHGQGAEVHSVVGFRSRDLVILEEEFCAVSDQLCMMTCFQRVSGYPVGSIKITAPQPHALTVQKIDCGKQYHKRSSLWVDPHRIPAKICKIL